MNFCYRNPVALIVALFACLFLSTTLNAQQERITNSFFTSTDWKLVADQSDSQTHNRVYIPATDSTNGWMMLVSMQDVLFEARTDNIDQLLKYYYDGAVQESSEAKITLIEKDSTSKNFWAIFKVESPHFRNDPVPESNLFYLVQGDYSAHNIVICQKIKEFNKEFVDKWSAILKNSKLVKD